MSRLTDLIRGIEPDDHKKTGAPQAAQTPPPAPTAPATPPPIQLRTLMGQRDDLASTAPPMSGSSMQFRKFSEESRSADLEVASGVVDWYAQADTALQTVTEAIRKQQPFSLGEIRQIAAAFVSSLAQDESLVVHAISHRDGGSLIGNMIHVGIFATRVGMGLGYRTDELNELAFAGLVHDLGMFQLPEQLLNHSGRWSKEQIAVMAKHPKFGAELLRKAAPEQPWLAEVALQEHERFDGSGYPRGLKGPQIHEFSLIIGVTDVMDAMLKSRPSRKALMPHEAVRLLLVREKAAFPTRVLKSVVQQFSLFPVGTWIKLTSGEIGEVTRSNPRFPLRPTVRIMIDQGGQRLREGRELDLSRNPLVHVSEIVEVSPIIA